MFSPLPLVLFTVTALAGPPVGGPPATADDIPALERPLEEDGVTLIREVIYLECWDVNENGEPDLETEDSNGDGSVDARDCRVAVYEPVPKMKVKRRVMPVYPDAARSTPFPNSGVECGVRFHIDVNGKPTNVEIQAGCPSVFHPSIMKAAWEWRFYPDRRDGEKVEGQFFTRMCFNIQGGVCRNLLR